MDNLYAAIGTGSNTVSLDFSKLLGSVDVTVYAEDFFFVFENIQLESENSERERQENARKAQIRKVVYSISEELANIEASFMNLKNQLQELASEEGVSNVLHALKVQHAALMSKLSTLDDLTGADEATRAEKKSLVTKILAMLDEMDRLLRATQVARSGRTWDSITNDRISQLRTDVQGPAINFINQAESELEIRLRVTQGLRTFAEQDALYAKGRTAPGEIVTNAKGGQSYHNYGLAIDVVEIRNCQTIWNTHWSAISKIGIRNGFEWGGNFKSIPDKPHFQMTFGYSISELLNLYNSGKW